MTATGSRRPPLAYRAHRAFLLAVVVVCALLLLYVAVVGAQPIVQLVTAMIEGVHDEWRSWNWTLG